MTFAAAVSIFNYVAVEHFVYLGIFVIKISNLNFYFSSMIWSLYIDAQVYAFMLKLKIFFL